MLPTLLIFFERKKFSPFYKPAVEWAIVSILFLGGAGLNHYCFRNLPIIDFRPYRIGANIPAGMEYTTKNNFDEQDFVFVYEKNGARKEFYISDLPDSSWHYIERIDKVQEEDLPEEPPIHDFGLSLGGVDYAPEMLADQGYSLLVVAHDLTKSDAEGFKAVASFTKAAVDKGYAVYGMSSTVDKTVEEVINTYGLPFDFYAADDITLKTMIRSNPGIILIKEGTVLAKWHYRNIPSTKFLDDQGMAGAVTESIVRQENYIILFVISLVAFLALGIYTFTLSGRRQKG